MVRRDEVWVIKFFVFRVLFLWGQRGLPFEGDMGSGFMQFEWQRNADSSLLRL
jgi:hypothetical protein